MKKNSKKNPEMFKGNKKVIKSILSFGQKARLTDSSFTKIPNRVLEIDSYPSILKKGKVPLTKENLEAAFKEFIKEHKTTFKVDAENLKLISAKNINKKWHIKYAQYYKGIPVYDACVSLETSQDGKVHSYLTNYLPDIKVNTKPVVKLSEAVSIATKTYPKKYSEKMIDKDSTLIIYPEIKDGEILHHLAWMFILSEEQTNPETEKYFIVDALDGKIISSYTANFPGATVSGTVRGEIYPTNPTDTVSTMPLQHNTVEILGVGNSTTNQSGVFSAHIPWWVEIFFPHQAIFRLEGPYARVRDNNGNDYVVNRNYNPGGTCNQTWTDTDRDHINLFYHMNLYHDWLLSELGYSWVNLDGTNRFNAQVNYSFSNAYAGNPMTFGTNNFARSSDVIYHECTHNVLNHEYNGYIGWPNNYTEAYAMDEGFADYFASSFTNESRHGEGYTSSPRDLNNTRQYQGKDNFNLEGHTGGTVIGGAAWVLRQRMIDHFGQSGARIADQLILEAHQILSTYPRNYFFSDPHESNLLSALYRAADIDNNLLNGFPYFYDIQKAFHTHNLLQAILEDGDSFDFSTNNLGKFIGGDLYYYQGKFWANNLKQKGVVDLGNIGEADLETVSIPNTGYTKFGVNAVAGNTYISKAQEGEAAGYIAFRVLSVSADKSKVTLRYLYRFNPNWHVANTRTLEIHKMDCHWVSLMHNHNKLLCKDLNEAAKLIKDSGYNGCHFCLPRYDTDALSKQKVISNLNEDLE